MSRARIRWSLFALFLAALGYGFWHFAAPSPRYTFTGDHAPLVMAADGRWLLTDVFPRERIKAPLRLWDLESGQSIAEFFQEGQVFGQLTVSKDERFLAAGIDLAGLLGVIDLQKRQARTIPIEAGFQCGHVLFSPDADLLALGEPSGKILVLETKTWRTVAKHDPGPRESFGFSPTGAYLYFLTREKVPRTVVWSARERKVVAAWEQVYVLEFLPKDHAFVGVRTNGKENEAVVCNVETGKQTLLVSTTLNQPVGALAPNQKWLAAWTQNAQELWDVASGKMLTRVNEGNIRWCHFSPDSSKLA
ncbi:MAG: WD40 repeat domain-containing protein, partial [Gemmataceae bacterium]|nr:WD40 repeat domain-containing protein [Gemmataceae bacterium]